MEILCCGEVVDDYLPDLVQVVLLVVEARKVREMIQVVVPVVLLLWRCTEMRP